MSFHYEVVFSMFLRDGIPGEVLDELHWHLGLTPVARKPRVCALDADAPVLCPSAGSGLAGGELATLHRQYRYTVRGVERFAWGLYARLRWLDDKFAEDWLRTVTWLAPFADDDGFAGFFRDEDDEQPVRLLIRDGQPYLSPYVEQPRALV